MNEAQALIDNEQYADALVLLNSELDANPNNMTALFQIGEVLLKTDRLGLAFNIYRILATEASNRSEVWNNLGRCLQTRQHAKQAEEYFRKALELDPQSAAAMINIAVMCVNEGRAEEAIKWASRALEIDSTSRQAIDALSMAKLQIEDWSGWDDYEKSEGPPFRESRQYCIPQEKEWQGEFDKTVVLYREQGLGDEILFSSCFQETIDRSKKVIVDCDARLQGLFQRSFPKADIYGTGYDKTVEWPKKYKIDSSAPFGRLPKFFRRRSEDFPGGAFLTACPLRRKAMRAMLDEFKGLKIGLAWNGGKRQDSVTIADSDYRSLSLRNLAPLMSAEHTYISLEYKPCQEEIDASGLEVQNFPWITLSKDYDDTAALVAELDLVIAVPTTVVHLAGALGTSCYTIIPEFPNWRFAGDMIWHDSVKLFKGIRPLKRFLRHEIRRDNPGRTGT